MDIKFYSCSAGEKGGDYHEKNYEKIIEKKAFIMHEDTTQKGLFCEVKIGDILIIKKPDNTQNTVFPMYGRVKDKKKLTEKSGWNDLIEVEEWFFHNLNDTQIGISTYGIADNTLPGSGQMGTVKGLNFEWALKKIEEINKNTSLFKEIKNQVKMNSYTKLLESNKNLIFTGAPGTGKTYLAKEIAKDFIKTTINKSPKDILLEKIDAFQVNEDNRKQKLDLLEKFQTLFPLENLDKLTLDEYCAGKGDRNNFCWWIESGLKSLGYYFPGSARTYLIYWKVKNDAYSKHGYVKNLEDEKALSSILTDLKEILETKNISKSKQKFGPSFILKLLHSYFPSEYAPVNSLKHLDNIISLFDIKSKSNEIEDKNKAVLEFLYVLAGDKLTPIEIMRLIYDNFNIKDGELVKEQGIDLTGETSFVQFHPSYDYTDFVEGLRPVKKDETLGFELKNGIFKAFCKKAKDNPNKKYVFIIDEINRAEISKVFGELMFSIDPGYRGINGAVATQYANIQEGDTIFDEELGEGKFYIPENVYIIGTMNDIDRSVESFDFALRRRFAWKEITAEYSSKVMLKDQSWKTDAITKMDALNTAIENINGLGSAYHIGAAYFLKLDNYKGDFTQLWENHLNGILSEYLRGMPNAKNDLDNLKKAYDDGKIDNDGQ